MHAPSPDVIIETVVQGGFAKVTAVDVTTGVEACVIGPSAAADPHLRSLALRKLERLLASRPEQALAAPAGGLRV